MINVISAVFRGAQSTTTRNAYQYDYGQVLKTNLALPETYEVQFSNNSSGGVAITQIGNADGVTIPDQMFISGAPIYAWIFLHQGADDGETVYFITIPVTKRAKPTSKQPTPVQKDAITQAIAALNAAVEQTGQDVEDANNAAESARESADAFEGMIAEEYDENKTYTIGDYSIHNDVLYRCTTAITTAETWTAAHWTAAVIGNDVSDIKNQLENLDDVVKTKVGFENTVDATMFETGDAVYTSGGLATTRRWFINRIFPSGTKINTIKFGATGNSTAARTLYIEIWEKSGNTLTKKKTVTVDTTNATATQEVIYDTVNIDYTSEAECMVCFLCTGRSSSVLYTTDTSGADNMLVSTDVTLSTSSLGYDTLATFSIKVYPDIEINYSYVAKVNAVFIGPGMDYEEIQDALIDITDDSATNPYVLFVVPKGTPYKPFSMLRNSWSTSYPWNSISPRYISVIGMDRPHCIIRSDSGNYKLPCGEPMTNGIIKNLTFVMTNDDQDPAATQGGYCLHIDCRTLNDVGYTMTIEDCDFEDASGPCLGIGMHKNCTLTIRRCNFKTTLSANYSPHEGYTNLYNYGVIFCHSSTRSDATNQRINIEDCFGVCAEGNKSLWLSIAGDYSPATASFYYRLLRNVFWNETQNAPAYSISGTLTAEPMNYGNNIPQ